MKDEFVSNKEDSSDTASNLLRAAIANDQFAWVDLVHRYSRRIYLQCRDSGLQDADAAEVMQGVFITVAKSLSKLRRDRPGDTFRGWLRTVTQSRIHDWYRRKGKEARIEATGGTDHCLSLGQLPCGDATTCSAQIFGPPSLEAQAVAQVRESCKPEHWQIYMAYVSETSTPEELAERFQVSVGNVYIIKSRLTQKIRKAYTQLARTETAASVTEETR
ncbi:MAG: sigma-70 family RNA polymerase sigma factor [Pirellulales bacterium]|nr:sigma-70 family RNA polymerase sigma factor [Pirellulales bacterium]